MYLPAGGDNTLAHDSLIGCDADTCGSDVTGASIGTVSASTTVARSLHVVLRRSCATYTGRRPQKRVMAPLCPRLWWLLKHTDCLPRPNISWFMSHGFDRRPHLWKRDLGSVGQPQTHFAPARSFAASAHGSSSDGHDVTERLWSVYHKTKKQTKGI